jgi:hypothetical protein
MITPTKDDIGRSVLYRTGPGEAERGFVTGFNGDYALRTLRSRQLRRGRST